MPDLFSREAQPRAHCVLSAPRANFVTYSRRRARGGDFISNPVVAAVAAKKREDKRADEIFFQAAVELYIRVVSV